MPRNYYITQPGRLRRKDNTLYLEPEEAPRVPIPVEDIDALYLYGELDLNTRLLNFLTQKHIPFHVFNYYGYYAGSYYPREYLNSGSLLVKQCSTMKITPNGWHLHRSLSLPLFSICCAFFGTTRTAVRIAAHKSNQLRHFLQKAKPQRTQTN